MTDPDAVSKVRFYLTLMRERPLLVIANVTVVQHRVSSFMSPQ